MSTRKKLIRPVHLVLDWDGTITTKDTMAMLGQLPAIRDKRLAAEPASEDTPTNLPTGIQWSDFAAAYLKDYNAHKAQHYPKDASPGSSALQAWLDSLHTIEYASALRVSDSAFFRGVTFGDVKTLAQEQLDHSLQLRPGWWELFAMFLAYNGHTPPLNSKISIISVNWSESFIRWTLYVAANRLEQMDPDQQEALLRYINVMDIHANEIHGLDRPMGSFGRLTGSIRTAKEKTAHMPPNDHPDALVIYAGDSVTDSLCLDRADFGIWVCECEEADVVERFGQAFPMKAGQGYAPTPITKSGVGHGRSGWLWSRDLAGVAAFLAGNE